MTRDGIGDLVGDDTVEYETPLRDGGRLAVTERELLVTRDATRIALDDVVEVTLEPVDWFLVVLGVAIVGFGLYSTARNAPVGVAFAAFGVLSLHWTYRKRGEVTIRVRSRAKPLTLYPADGDEFYGALARVMDEG